MAKTLLLHYLMTFVVDERPSRNPGSKIDDLILSVASGNFVNECDINAYAARLDDFAGRCLISAYKLYIEERNTIDDLEYGNYDD